MGLRLGSLCFASVALVGCSTTFDPKSCAVDEDCGSSAVCEVREDQNVCVSPADAKITLGQSAPFSGTNQALGTGMRLGIMMALDEANAAGGIRGRQLELVFRDDGYDPLQAEANARVLVDAQASTQIAHCMNSATPVSNGAVPPVLTPVTTTAITRGPNAVLAMLGSVGTPTMVRSAPVAIESGTLYFGAFTGAGTLLRDTSSGDCAKYIFNVRASYAQEARATMEYFINKTVATSASDYRNLISFDQNDTFGDAGYKGLTEAFKAIYTAFPGSADPTTPIARFRYTRGDDNSVPAQAVAAENYLTNLLGSTSGTLHIGVLMTDTYGAGVAFIKHLRTWQFDGQGTTNKATRIIFHFSNVSFVGPNKLSSELVSAGSVTTPTGTMPLTQDVVVSQVVPNYQSDASDVVQQYNRLIAQRGDDPGFTSLEGYISTRVFLGGLAAHEGPMTPESLIKSFETLPDLRLGIGANAGLSATNHQYSSSVWGTGIQPDGTFKDIYFWTVGSPIQFFQ